MSIRYECDQCGSVLKIKDDLAGKPGKCPKCKTPFTVPAGDDDSGNQSDVATEASDVAEPVDSGSRLTDSGDDFDVDAFLSSDEDGGSKPNATLSKSKIKAVDDDADQSLDDEVDKPKSKRSKSRANKADTEDSFEIRRGPDAPGKSALPMTSGLDDDADETPAPVRRPPGTNPNAAASNIASDLLSKSAKKGKKANWDEVQPQKKDEEPVFDWDALKYEARTKLLPVAGGGFIVCLLIYFFVFPMFGSKAYAPKLAPVTGTVVVDGKPLAGAEVWFHPEQKQQDAKGKQFKVSSSFGKTDTSGHYELMYDQDHKGVAIGKCRIEIVTVDYSGIHEKFYRNKKGITPMSIEVKAGSQVVDLDLSQ